jgi:hypothetical protein
MSRGEINTMDTLQILADDLRSHGDAVCTDRRATLIKTIQDEPTLRKRFCDFSGIRTTTGTGMAETMDNVAIAKVFDIKSFEVAQMTSTHDIVFKQMSGENDTYADFARDVDALRESCAMKPR